MRILDGRTSDKPVHEEGKAIVHGDEDTGTALRRGLKERHMTMISVGGVIGTGLFLGTASSLSYGGPLGLLLGYTFIGSICLCVMVSVGEMISLLPLAGGHIRLAERFVDPAFSFAMGWNCWYSWTVPELAAAATLFEYWDLGVNNAVWITMCLVVAIGINFFGVGVYGEAEFMFASIKVITIVGLIVLGIVLDLGGGPNHDRIGFRYWKDPGPFVQYDGIPGAKGRFLGFFRVLTQAAFSFTGTEVVAITAAEAKNPRETIPKAIRSVYVRILLFYILGVFVIGLLVPSNQPLLNLDSNDASASPFVIAIEMAGIGVLPSIINAALITSAWSAACSDVYLSSRALYGLALSTNAPHVFTLTTRTTHIPYASLALTSLLSLLSYTATQASAGVVFTYFADMAATAGLLAWFCVGVTYVRFFEGLRVQRGMGVGGGPWCQPWAAWWAFYCALPLARSCTRTQFSGWQVFLRDEWSTSTFVTTYLPIILFPVLFGVAKVVRGTELVKPEEMDFKTGAIEGVDEGEAE
ncbi:amino acid permease [Phlebopus sp. FC_14]|nr:amino acid permease [Phlebopus sp. FC_14]